MRLLDTLLTLVTRERRGEVIDRSLMRSTTLVSLSVSSLRPCLGLQHFSGVHAAAAAAASLGP